MAARATGSSRRSRMDGTLIGEFRIGDEIGKGSFATVYKGIHRSSNALVAVKSVNLAKLNKKLKENLYSEIDILKGLQHPHIVALIDCKESTTHIHLVMEYCELGDLSHFIKKRDTLGNNPALVEMTKKYPNPPSGGLNEVISRHFLKQLASALEFLRARNFIHRDVKPQNLLLNPSSKYLANTPDTPLIMSVSENADIPATGIPTLPMLKIADFGFARSLPSTSLAETLCGSPLYMAPEILRYEKYDAKADLWSVGTVLFEMTIGKPPFRAANHVELLRKIEQGEDVIKFPRESEVSPAMKSLIRSLLKRNPVERLSFESFFANEVITEQIPGLVGEDRPRRPVEAADDRRRSSMREVREERQVVSEQSSRPLDLAASPSSSKDRAHRSSLPGHDEKMSARPVPGTSPRMTAPRSHGATDPINTSHPPKRPLMQPSVTSPNFTQGRVADPRPQHITRNVSHDIPAPRTKVAGMNEPQQYHRADRERQEKEDKAAHDVMFERDYVVIEKRAVEVNAFADQLAADPRLTSAAKDSSPSTRHGAMVRRATTQGTPSSVTGAVPTQSSRAVQIAQGEGRPEHQRQSSSYERRYGASPTSVTSAISKAVAGASLRMLGVNLSPQMLGKGQSPPQLYSPFPTYPAGTGISGLIADGKPVNPQDEDAKAVFIIEESATRSDVVYGFAEVKYRQLIPLAPSMDHGLGGHMSAEDGSNQPDAELTADAIVTLSEEALVLYVKALSLLAKSMDVAGAWWSKTSRGEVLGNGNFPPRSSSPSVVAAGNRINSAVQWVRSRFNEVLEKAEFVRLKLVEAQKQLPEDHPSHPTNHSTTSHTVEGTSVTGDGVVLSPGVTAEKLMYDRAVEMSKSAALNELTNTDLQGCEISYVTALRMIEAVLDNDDEYTPRRASAQSDEKGSRAEESGDEGLFAEDRQSMQNLLTMLRGRLHVLRKKMTAIHKHQSLPTHLSRPSSNYSGGTTPTITSTPPS